LFRQKAEKKSGIGGVPTAIGQSSTTSKILNLGGEAQVDSKIERN